MRSQELSCFSPPMMRVMSQEPSCSSMEVSHRYSLLQTSARKEEWNGNSRSQSTTLQPDNVTTIRGGRSFIKSWCRPTGSCRVCERIKVAGHLRRVGRSDQPKHGGIRSDVVLGIRSRCRRSERNRTRETEDHEASDRQSSSHEGDGQACSGRGGICACDRARL